MKLLILIKYRFFYKILYCLINLELENLNLDGLKEFFQTIHYLNQINLLVSQFWLDQSLNSVILRILSTLEVRLMWGTGVSFSRCQNRQLG